MGWLASGEKSHFPFREPDGCWWNYVKSGTSGNMFLEPSREQESGKAIAWVFKITCNIYIVPISSYYEYSNSRTKIITTELISRVEYSIN